MQNVNSENRPLDGDITVNILKRRPETGYLFPQIVRWKETAEPFARWPSSGSESYSAAGQTGRLTTSKNIWKSSENEVRFSQPCT